MRLWKKLGFPKPKSEASKGELSLVDNEIYSGIEVPKMPLFIRLDGWKFHPLAKELKLNKPFDKFFAECMAKTASSFFDIFNPSLAYGFSDEINLLFIENPTFRRIEKIDSVFAGFASTTFSSLLRKKKKYAKYSREIAFDCRCIPLKKQQIIRYLVWRQAEAFRNHNNAWAQYALLKKGLSPRSVAKKLEGIKTKDIYKLLKEKGINVSKIPIWQRRGIFIYKEKYKKKGYNPIKKKYVWVERFKTKIDWKPPEFNTKEGKKILSKLLVY